MESLYDVIIIGGGPTGLSIGRELQKENLKYLILEKNNIGNHISQFPNNMTFFSTKDLLELDNFPLTITQIRPTKEEYLIYLNKFVEFYQLNIKPYHEVIDINKNLNQFEILCKHKNKTISFYSKYLVLAMGAWKPKLINIPGEDLPYCSHYFIDPQPYYKQNVCIVGGGNSAVETALILYRYGANVTIVYRKNQLDPQKIKYWLLPDIEGRIRKNQIHAFFNSQIEKIEDYKVYLKNVLNNQRTTLDIDFVLLLTGYIPDYTLYLKLGGKLYDNKPKYNPETLESEIPKVFLAGVYLAGDISGKTFIENSREHGKIILNALKKAKF
ncbi:MAG: thioredoxin reductase [Leptospiraceae bacterium]|nr:MAG: thioredoxin reductase [Leptospiraceae bacterium]